MKQDFEYLAIDDGRDPSSMWAENAFVEPAYFSYDDFNYTDRIYLYDYTLPYYPSWINLSTLGTDGKLLTAFNTILLYPWTTFVAFLVLTLWPFDLAYYVLRWVY